MYNLKSNFANNGNGVTETFNKYHGFLYGHVSDDAWPSVILTHTCISGLIVVVVIATTLIVNFSLNFSILIGTSVLRKRL